MKMTRLCISFIFLIGYLQVSLAGDKVDTDKAVPDACIHSIGRGDNNDAGNDGDVNCAVTNNDDNEARQSRDRDGDTASSVLDNIDDPVLLASTIDGGLTAIDRRTGAVRWRLTDEPVVKSPYNPEKPVLPAFLPDPKDGALYIMGASRAEPIKKLPMTIPELVAGSPSQTPEGILYTGKKVDTWFSVDRITGARKGTLSHAGCFYGPEPEDTCPAVEAGTFLIGRTEYNIMMYDTRSRDRKWNITYYDYTSVGLGLPASNPRREDEYDLVHFSDSATGAILTLDKRNGELRWEAQFTSPVVAMYQLEKDQLTRVPFTSVSSETLENLVQQIGDGERGEKKLFPTLYVGEHAHGLFAVPSLVDKKTMLISPAKVEEQFLLEGPKTMSETQNWNQDYKEKDAYFADERFMNERPTDLVFGHYQDPGKDRRQPPVRLITNGLVRLIGQDQIKLIADASQPVDMKSAEMSSRLEGANNGSSSANTLPGAYHPTNSQDSPLTEEFRIGFTSLRQFNTTFIFSRELPRFLVLDAVPVITTLVARLENKELKIMLLVLFVTVIWFVRYVQVQGKRLQTSLARSSSEPNPFSPHNRGSYGSSTGSGTGSGQSEVTAMPIELETGEIKVGNITFSPDRILGKGCEGTFVYKGKFDNRDVAVKRVLAACFSIADREVELLRESDEHPNVIRYFCMEQCKQFRYIALELCVATLQDLVEGKYSMPGLDITSIFKQGLHGLSHLHGLEIAHRDIKPQNVLLSAPNHRGEVRAMISDFGLCKKLKLGRMSFSQRSGIAGTEGWIAPEILTGHTSATCMVDIFSFGCVYYYLLTSGKHPFGETFHRQANILYGRYDTDQLMTEEELQATTYGRTAVAPSMAAHLRSMQRDLIQKMISREPKDRPPASAILKHPLFWSKEKVLAFLQEVSDRIDKDDDNSIVVVKLEEDASSVVKNDWLSQLDDRVRDDLRRQRTYKGNTVKDLLRAIRNKKHHYRELHHSIKERYGTMPHQFADYWNSRFPKLLLHTYHTMQCIKYEGNFSKYYSMEYDFLKCESSWNESATNPSYGLDVCSPKSYRPAHTLVTSDGHPRFQRDLFSSNDSSLQDSNVISEWEDLDSMNSKRNDSEKMLPCKADPFIYTGRPTANSAQYPDQAVSSSKSLLGYVEAAQKKAGSPLSTDAGAHAIEAAGRAKTPAKKTLPMPTLRSPPGPLSPTQADVNQRMVRLGGGQTVTEASTLAATLSEARKDVLTELPTDAAPHALPLSSCPTDSTANRLSSVAERFFYPKDYEQNSAMDSSNLDVSNSACLDTAKIAVLSTDAPKTAEKVATENDEPLILKPAYIASPQNGSPWATNLAQIAAPPKPTVDGADEETPVDGKPGGGGNKRVRKRRKHQKKPRRGALLAAEAAADGDKAAEGDEEAEEEEEVGAEEAPGHDTGPHSAQ